MGTKYESVDAYISSFPKEVQDRLEEIRSLIIQAAKDATEKISYNIPAYYLNGRYLIYFAGYKKHIGLYPVPTNKEFEKDFMPYKTSGKGAIQFPLDKPLPLDLIRKIVKYKMQFKK